MWHDTRVSNKEVSECVSAILDNGLHLMRIHQYADSPHAMTYIRLLEQLFEADDLKEFSFDDIANAFNYILANSWVSR